MYLECKFSFLNRLLSFKTYVVTRDDNGNQPKKGNGEEVKPMDLMGGLQ